MGKFNRGDKFGSKRDNRNRGAFRGERPTMFAATCTECGKACEVPFKPTGNKPVYCSNCFEKKDGGSSRFEKRSSNRSGFGDKPMFKAVCDSCGKNCEVPFRPTGDKPVYCNDCFGKGDKRIATTSAKVDQYKQQFIDLNNKLDAILEMLASKSSAAKTKVKPAAKTVVKKPTTKKATTKKVVAKKKK